ncbi:MAG: GyrI-like domain-containing protein [Lachnospiraceae bacterium]|nr:GyrI-like domain-containing protein [Lachnospiraceae bacterium]
MAFDFKKEYKEFYLPKNKPGIVTVPGMNYMAVRGMGDPNREDGEYKQSIGLLYGIAFTIKMSTRRPKGEGISAGDHQIDGYFDYVVPPLEGFWWQETASAKLNYNTAVDVPSEGSGRCKQNGIAYAHKEDFHWISVIRLPDFVTEDGLRWAIEEATRKKKQDFSKVEFLTIEEGLCVQCMHIGSYDDEPATIAMMHEFMEQQGYKLDITDKRRHHEIYLSDARRVAPEKLKTVIRHPIKRKES